MRNEPSDVDQYQQWFKALQYLKDMFASAPGSMSAVFEEIPDTDDRPDRDALMASCGISAAWIEEKFTPALYEVIDAVRQILGAYSEKFAREGRLPMPQSYPAPQQPGPVTPPGGMNYNGHPYQH
jgi:hypothetical protein